MVDVALQQQLWTAPLLVVAEKRSSAATSTALPANVAALVQVKLDCAMRTSVAFLQDGHWNKTEYNSVSI